MTRDQLVCWPR